MLWSFRSRSSPLTNLKSGGRLVINAIRKEAADRDALLQLDYSSHLWHEKEIKSVANVTRLDVSRFLELADRIPIIPEVEIFSLAAANRALMKLKKKANPGRQGAGDGLSVKMLGFFYRNLKAPSGKCR